MSQEIYDLAAQWVLQGISVIPINWTNKHPYAYKWRGAYLLPIDPEDNRPTWEPYKTSLPTIQELYHWFIEAGCESYGVITGCQNLAVIDFDTLHFYFSWRESFPTIQTFMVMTSRGVHAYFYINEPVKSFGITVAGIHLGEVRAGGEYVLGPGSLHPSRSIYQVIGDYPILTVDRLQDVFWNCAIPESNPHTEHKTLNLGPIESMINDPWVMASNPSNRDLIQKIRQRFLIQNFFSDLEPTGKNFYMTWCPFHKDKKTRSLWINTKKKICNCYTCRFDLPMDVINFYARLHGIGEEQARQELAARL